MNITSRQLKAFVLTARHQSFSRAAEQLFITQSGMSLLVRELETQLGVRLFERTTRKVALTEFGTQFLPIADRNVRELEAAALNLSRSAASVSHCLSIGAAPFPAAEIMPRAISIYGARNPRLQIRMFDAERARLLEMVSAGKIEVAVITGLPAEPPPGMRKTALARFAMMLICPAAGARRLPVEVRWGDVAALRLVGLRAEHHPVQEPVREQLARAGRTEPPDVTCNFLETQIAMVEAGVGAAVIPSTAVSACAKRKVTMHSIVDPVVRTDFCWVSNSAHELSQNAEDFGEFLRGYLTHIADLGPRVAVRAA